MAFDYTNLYPDTSGNGGFTKSWNYTSVVDNVAACAASGYFNKVASRLGIGDNIVVAQVDAFDKSRTALLDHGVLFVNSISGGVVTVVNATVGTVISVAGRTGAVTLAVGDVTGAAPVASPTFTGAPAVPTAAVDTNTTQIADTAFVIGQAASATPLVNGVAAVGTSTRFARADHVHPMTAGQLLGTATNDNATAGNVGEYIFSDIVTGSAVALTTSTDTNLTSISLTAGDWEVCLASYYSGGGTTTVTRCISSINAVSAVTNTNDGFRNVVIGYGATIFGTYSGVFPVLVGPVRFSLSTTTTIFAVVNGGFAVSTMSAFGLLRARRVR